MEQHSKFLLHTLQVLYMCTACDSTIINTHLKCIVYDKLLKPWQSFRIALYLNNIQIFSYFLGAVYVLNSLL